MAEAASAPATPRQLAQLWQNALANLGDEEAISCLLYTSDAADERSSVDLGGRRIIKKKKTRKIVGTGSVQERKDRIDIQCEV